MYAVLQLLLCPQQYVCQPEEQQQTRGLPLTISQQYGYKTSLPWRWEGGTMRLKNPCPEKVLFPLKTEPSLGHFTEKNFFFVAAGGVI